MFIFSDCIFCLVIDEEVLFEVMGFVVRFGLCLLMNEVVDFVILEVLKGLFELRICYKGRGDVKLSWWIIELFGLFLGLCCYFVGIDIVKCDGWYCYYWVEDIMDV